MRARHHHPRIPAAIALTLAAIVLASTHAREAAAVCEGRCLPNFTSVSVPEVVVGSPSGQARPFNVSLTISSSTSATIQEVWIGYEAEFACTMDCPRPYSPAGGDLRCFEPLCGDLTWPYQQVPGSGATSASATFYPRFGASTSTKSVEIQILDYCSALGSPPHSGYFYNTVPTCVIARSTDLDDDGDTDQDDKILIGRELRLPAGSRDQRFNLNTDFISNTVVDGGDYQVIVDEMHRTQPTTLYYCLGIASENPDQAIVPNHLPDGSAPGSTSLSVASQNGYSLTLQWLAPGDDTDDSVHGYQQLGVAEEYDLRWSCSPITASNFTSATRYTTVPLPALAGTSQSVTLTANASARHWAMRTKDHAGNWSAVGPDLQVPVGPQTIFDLTVCAAFKNCALVGWTPASPTATYAFRYSTTAITEDNFCSAENAATPSLFGGLERVFAMGLSQGTTYYFAARSIDNSGPPSSISNVASAQTPTVGYSCRTNIDCSGDGGFRAGQPFDESRTAFELAVPTPNPGKGARTMSYSIPAELSGQVLELAIFDAAGRRVTKLVDGSSVAGTFSVSWDLRTDAGGRARPGFYFARLRVGTSQLKRSVVVTQ